MNKILLTLIIVIVGTVSCIAQWPSNRNFPKSVASTQGNEIILQTLPDDAGGVYVVWRKAVPPHYGDDLFLAHYNAAGEMLLNTPVYSSDTHYHETLAGIISDGVGGVVIVWGDQRTNPDCHGGCSQEFYGQHISVDGARLWPESGLLLFSGIADPLHTQIVKASLVKGTANEFYLVFDQHATCGALEVVCPNTTNKIVAQRYHENGTPLWPEPQEVYSSTGTDEIFNFDARYDEATNRLFVVWQDGRANTHWYPSYGYTTNVQNFDLYAQSINGSTGEKHWAADGVMVNNVVDVSWGYDRSPNPEIAIDANGIVITWVDYRVENQKSIYGTRLSKMSGARYTGWASSGKLLSSHLISDLHYVPEQFIEYPVKYDLQAMPGNTFLLVYPGNGNILYAQKFNTSGHFQWGAGTAVSNDPGAFNGYPTVVMHANEPTIIWTKTLKHVSGTPPATTLSYTSTLYAQKLNENGSVAWQTPTQVTNTVNGQLGTSMAVSDNNGGVYIGWSEGVPDHFNYDVRMTSLSPAGKFKGGLTISSAAASGGHGEIVTIPITVKDFDDILTLQGSLQWNPDIVSFVEVTDFGLPGLQTSSFGLANTASGSLAFSWDDLNGEGEALPQDAVLFKVKFELIGLPGTESDLILSNSPVPIEAYYESDYAEAPVSLNHGFITIDYYALTITTQYLAGNNVDQGRGPIADVDLYLDLDWFGKTNESGVFVIPAFPDPSQPVQTLSPQKTNGDTEGIDVADIIMTRDHIVGTIPFNSPYRLFAADVDGSGFVSTIDIAQIRAVILGKESSFKGKHWTFVNDYEFFSANEKYDVAQNPFTYVDHLALDYNALDLDQLLTPGAIRFVGVKLGDIDASWAESNEITGGRTRDEAQVSINAVFPAVENIDEPFDVVFQSEKMNDLAGIQFTLQWNVQELAYKGFTAEQLPVLLNEDKVSEGLLTVLWHRTSQENVSLAKGAELFKLSFLPKVFDVKLEMNSTVTKAIAFNGKLKPSSIEFNRLVANDEGLRSGVYPSPFSDNLTVSFSTPVESPVEFELVDAMGGKAMSESWSFAAGNHNHTLNTSGVARGIYVLRLKVGRTVKSFKVLKR